MEEDDFGDGVSGIMKYDVIKDIVLRYVGCLKEFEVQLESAHRMYSLQSMFKSDIAKSLNEKDIERQREEYKIELQKNAWEHIFNMTNVNKYATKQVKDDINKFIVEQQKIPFSMKNIYRMLEIIVGTRAARMDNAIEDIFDYITKYYHDNRYNVPGWKTNSAYLINTKFIFPHLVATDLNGGIEISVYRWDEAERIDDIQKVLCYLTGKDYSTTIDIRNKMRYKKFIKSNDKFVAKFTGRDLRDGDFEKTYSRLLEEKAENLEVIENNFTWGEWTDWGFFEIKCYKKGTLHFKFKDLKHWELLNREVGRIKGLVLPEKII